MLGRKPLQSHHKPSLTFSSTGNQVESLFNQVDSSTRHAPGKTGHRDDDTDGPADYRSGIQEINEIVFPEKRSMHDNKAEGWRALNADLFDLRLRQEQPAEARRGPARPRGLHDSSVRWVDLSACQQSPASRRKSDESGQTQTAGAGRPGHEDRGSTARMEVI